MTASTLTTSNSITKPDRFANAPWLKWVIAITVSFAAILEVVDSSIVNVALPDMQGNLGATLSEVGWVITGYGIATAIMIPLTAWLGDFFGRKRYFLFSLIGFTISSVFCGFATNLPMLVAGRILQGLCGGGLIAKAQSILFETFPKEEQGMAQALFGIGVIVGPVIGPTLGGFLTDTLGWRWIFFINIPFGILAITMAAIFLPNQNERKISKVDWLGISLLVIFISCLQTVLEQGQQEDWFSSKMITTLTIIGVVGAAVFIFHELRTKLPAVNLRVLKYRSLSGGSLYSLMLGMGLYGATFAVPIFCQNILHYTAMQTGMLMLPSAIASGLMMPVIGKLSGKVDPRVMIGGGAIGSAVSMFMLASMNPDTSAESMFWPLLLRGAASVFMFMSLSMASVGALPKASIPDGSGIYNLARQIGGSLGIAIITLVLDQREAFHRAMLVSNFSEYNPIFRDRLATMTGAFQAHSGDFSLAHTQALASLNGMLNVQASILSFADIFRMVGLAFIISLPLLFLLANPFRGAAKEALNAH
ncbi:MAG TPA: DHA2 family efflux MFS transporter permease subunit [Drouetiella sp.]|jgi:MFS transporter, DHA2 family, multidrug resistance protein